MGFSKLCENWATNALVALVFFRQPCPFVISLCQPLMHDIFVTTFTFDYVTPMCEKAKCEWKRVTQRKRERIPKRAHKSHHHLHQKHLFMQIKFSILCVPFICAVVIRVCVSVTKRRYEYFIINIYMCVCSVWKSMLVLFHHVIMQLYDVFTVA